MRLSRFRLVVLLRFWNGETASSRIRHKDTRSEFLPRKSRTFSRSPSCNETRMWCSRNDPTCPRMAWLDGVPLEIYQLILDKVSNSCWRIQQRLSNMQRYYILRTWRTCVSFRGHFTVWHFRDSTQRWHSGSAGHSRSLISKIPCRVVWGGATSTG